MDAARHAEVRKRSRGVTKRSPTNNMATTLSTLLLLTAIVSKTEGRPAERSTLKSFSKSPVSSRQDSDYHPPTEYSSTILPPGVPPPQLDLTAPSDFGETNTDPPEELKRSTTKVVYLIQAEISRKLRRRKFDASKTRAKVFYQYRSPEPSPSQTPSPTPTVSYKPHFPYRPVDRPDPHAQQHGFRLVHPLFINLAAVRRLAGGSREPTQIRVWLQFDRVVWRNAVLRTIKDILAQKGLRDKFSSSRKYIERRQDGRAFLVLITFNSDYRARLLF